MNRTDNNAEIPVWRPLTHRPSGVRFSGSTARDGAGLRYFHGGSYGLFSTTGELLATAYRIWCQESRRSLPGDFAQVEWRLPAHASGGGFRLEFSLYLAAERHGMFAVRVQVGDRKVWLKRGPWRAGWQTHRITVPGLSAKPQATTIRFVLVRDSLAYQGPMEMWITGLSVRGAGRREVLLTGGKEARATSDVAQVAVAGMPAEQQVLAAMNLKARPLAPVREALAAGDLHEAFARWGEYFDRRATPRPYVEADKYRRVLNRHYPHRLSYHRREADRLLKNVPTILPRAAKVLAGNAYQLRPLWMAFAATGDPRYAECFREVFLAGYESHALSSLKNIRAGLKAHVFLDAYTTMCRLFVGDAEFNGAMLRVLLGLGRWLYQRNQWPEATNHQFTGAAGLGEIGMLLPEFRESARWVRQSAEILSWQLREAVFDDGGEKERSPGYHMVCLAALRRVAVIAHRNGVAELDFFTHPELAPRLESMYAWARDVSTPLGCQPAFNDAIYGVGHIDPLAEGAYYFRRPDLAIPLAGRLAKRPFLPDEVDLDCLAGSPEAFAPRRLGNGKKVPARSMPAPSRLFEDSKYAVMRSGWGADDLYLAVNFGGPSLSHSHYDALSFVMFAFGEPMALDPGIPHGYSYRDIRNVRAHGAHNVVEVDETGPRHGNKGGELISWSSLPGMDILALRHRGYEHLGVIHERKMLFIRGEYWLVSDLLVNLSASERALRWWLNTPFRLRGRGRRLLSDGKGPGLALHDLGDVGGRNIRRDRILASFPIRSARDGVENASVRNLHRLALCKPLPAGGSGSYATLLQPYRRRPAEIRTRSLPVFSGDERLPARQAEAFRIDRSRACDHVLISHDFRPETILSWGDFRTDCRICFVRTKADRLVGFVLQDATMLRRGDELLFAGHVYSGSRVSLAAVEVAYTGRTLELSVRCGGFAGRVRVFAPGAERLVLNGKPHSFRREGAHLIVSLA